MFTVHYCPLGDVPISTPYLNLFYPFSDAGVDDLTALLTSTVNQTRGGWLGKAAKTCLTSRLIRDSTWIIGTA